MESTYGAGGGVSAPVLDADAGAGIVWMPASDGATRLGLRGSDEIVVEWTGVGRLVASRTGRGHTFMPVPGLTSEWVEKFERTHVAGCLRYLSHRLSLHGAAVRFGDCVVALLGDSGAGKSTMAAALAGLGGALVADDLVALEWSTAGVPLVSPSGDAVWLLDDAARHFALEVDRRGRKVRHAVAAASEVARLGVIVVLMFDDNVSGPVIERLAGVEAFTALSRAHVCYVTEHPAEATEHLQERARLAAAARLVAFRRPRDLAMLDAGAKLIVESIRGAEDRRKE